LASHDTQGKAQVTGYSLGEIAAETDRWESDDKPNLDTGAYDESESN
jgi:hypothetical protein